MRRRTRPRTRWRGPRSGGRFAHGCEDESAGEERRQRPGERAERHALAQPQQHGGTGDCSRCAGEWPDQPGEDDAAEERGDAATGGTPLHRQRGGEERRYARERGALRQVAGEERKHVRRAEEQRGSAERRRPRQASQARRQMEQRGRRAEERCGQRVEAIGPRRATYTALHSSTSPFLAWFATRLVQSNACASPRNWSLRRSMGGSPWK